MLRLGGEPQPALVNSGRQGWPELLYWRGSVDKVQPKMPEYGIPDTPSQSDFEAPNGLRIARVDARPKRRSFCIVALFRAAMLLFGCVVAPTAAALDAAQGPVVSQASEHEGISTALVDEDVLVFIPDDALRWEISQKYGCRDGPIHSACMARLRYIRIGPDVADLTGLEFARNVWSLSISAPRVTDLSPSEPVNDFETLPIAIY